MGTTAMSLIACSTSTSLTDSAAATSQEATAATVTVEDNYGVHTVPSPPQRVVSTDNRSFETLNQWGVTLLAVPKPVVPYTIESYKKDDAIVDLGSHKEPNLEALVAAQPDLVISGQRFAKYHDEIAMLNPGVVVVDFEPRQEQPLDKELIRQTLALGEIFGKHNEAKKLVEDFEKSIERAKKAYNGTDTVMAVNVSGGKIGYIGPKVGRTFGPVFDILNLTPALDVKDASSNHEGDDISVEAIAESNPAWIFVMDRDGAIAAGKGEQFSPAEQVVKNNVALAKVSAVAENKMIFAPTDTYFNEGIITYTRIFNKIADAFETANK
ncbi:MAG: ABC transporter substrate-binding protein [Corynebacterium sp.]|uniref:siderophore ABC transporter substrate-binding protein n=1 Tax=Corynebacterium sp. TaxID=1720 RepID=UPI0026DC5BEA|nr:ABC transporter substrate-binding protein [Corynebacterium sp.]MDO4762677.1 ABC transporter substrate-binding protein [Corynebacterium sp.]